MQTYRLVVAPVLALFCGAALVLLALYGEPGRAFRIMLALGIVVFLVGLFGVGLALRRWRRTGSPT